MQPDEHVWFSTGRTLPPIRMEQKFPPKAFLPKAFPPKAFPPNAFPPKAFPLDTKLLKYDERALCGGAPSKNIL